ncbi:phage tail tape measure protein [Kluyvera intermedia]|uniref:Phage tail tape measure protein n=1 Tax=Kluyvera intermedia TaxID=61648 RepID=A0ABX3UHP1_KLUIN|nr:phage tail tape measure protein [Kluyvera intermedia]ORJ50990.1 phage tail tape measure protein [Kluyvera intermedia]
MSDSLKLQVLLKAVDQASRPFNAVQTASRNLSGEIRGAQNELKDLNARARQIEGFRKTSAQLAVTGNALNDAKAQAASLAIQMRNTANPTAAQVRALESARQSASALQTTYDSLRLSVQRQRDGLQQAGINTRQLSAAERQLRSDIAQTTDTLTRQRAVLARVGQQQERLNAVRARYERGRDVVAGARNTSAAALGLGTAGLFAGSRLMATVVESKKSGALIAARQGESSASGTQYTRTIQDISTSGISGDIEQITDAVSAVRSTLGTLGNVGEAELTRITRKALDMQTAFGTDTTESIQIAAIMMKNGLAASSDQAMDLIVSGMQRVSTEMRGELPEILHEYSTHFRNMGFTGAEAMSLLVDMSKQGKFALDKTGDAIKEFSIRGSDMSKNSVAAYKQIGLDAKKMSTDIASGGAKARVAMQKTATGLLKIKNPAERANAAIALFGTPVEDLSVDQIPKFLAALAGTKNQLGDVSGAADAMGNTLRDNLSGDVDKLQGALSGLRLGVFSGMDDSLRGLTQTAARWVNQLTVWVKAHPALVSSIVMVAGAVTGLVAVLGGVGLVLWPVMAGINALIAGAGLLATGFSIAGGTIASAVGAIAWPVVAVVAAIVAGALLIRKYWEPVSAFFGGVVEGLRAAFGPVADIFAPLAPVFDVLSGWLQKVWQWFKDLIAPVQATQETLNSCRDVGVMFGQALAEALMLPLTAFNKLRSGIDWVLEKLGVINKDAATLDQTAAKAGAVAARSGGGALVTGAAAGDPSYQPVTRAYPGYQSYQPVTAPAGRSYVDQSKSEYNITLQGGGAPGGNISGQLREELERHEREKRARARASMMHDGE